MRVNASFLNPHKVLGVSETADVKEVKRAYRKLALQYHPDRCKDDDGHEKFILLTQAYEMLLGRAEGKTNPDHASASGWDFHDWYWSFRMARSWEKQQGKAAAAAAAAAAASGAASGAQEEDGWGRRQPPHSHAGFKQPEARNNLRSQLAGLRHRAAVRANRPSSSSAPPPAAASPSSSFTSTAAAYPHHTATACWAAEQQQDSHTARRQQPFHDEYEEEQEQHDPYFGRYSAAGASAAGQHADAGSDAESDVEEEQDSEAYRQLYNQFTHVMSGASVDGTQGDEGQHHGPVVTPRSATDGRMRMQDGHYGTVLNHAVPFGASAAAAAAAAASTDGDVPKEQKQQESEELGLADGDPEPFSAPFSGAAKAGQQQQRRRFVNGSNVREAVSHQLAGLRRKAALKSTFA